MMGDGHLRVPVQPQYYARSGDCSAALCHNIGRSSQRSDPLNYGDGERDGGVDVGAGDGHEDGGQGGDGQARHDPAVRLGRARARVHAGGGHQADQQRVEERGDTLRRQRPPEREGPRTRQNIFKVVMNMSKR